MEIDINHLRSWIGKKETHDDTATAFPVAALSATLDRKDPPPKTGDVIPHSGHWLYFLETAANAELGHDGHPRRGGFLPPVTLPRRMWAGGRIDFRAPVRVGDAIRRDSEIPIVLYVYYNLLHRCGVENFIADAARAGVDGLLVLDLPPEEADAYEQLMRRAGLCAIWLVAPTTPEDRIAQIVRRGTGFIYYVSREGVTGMQSSVAGNLADRVALIRRHATVPIVIGFGISNPQQARQVAFAADGAVVGSAVVNQIAQLGNSPALVPTLEAFVKSLADGVKAA